MAKFIAEFDTNEKTLVLTKNGEAMANVVGVNFGCSWDDKDEFCCDIVMATKDEADDIRTYTRLSANEKGDLTTTDQSKPDAKKAEAAELQAELAQWFPVKKHSTNTAKRPTEPKKKV